MSERPTCSNVCKCSTGSVLMCGTIPSTYHEEHRCQITFSSFSITITRFLSRLLPNNALLSTSLGWLLKPVTKVYKMPVCCSIIHAYSERGLWSWNWRQTAVPSLTRVSLLTWRSRAVTIQTVWYYTFQLQYWKSEKADFSKRTFICSQMFGDFQMWKQKESYYNYGIIGLLFCNKKEDKIRTGWGQKS